MKFKFTETEKRGSQTVALTTLSEGLKMLWVPIQNISQDDILMTANNYPQLGVTLADGEEIVAQLYVLRDKGPKAAALAFEAIGHNYNAGVCWMPLDLTEASRCLAKASPEFQPIARALMKEIDKMRATHGETSVEPGESSEEAVRRAVLTGSTGSTGTQQNVLDDLLKDGEDGEG